MRIRIVVIGLVLSIVGGALWYFPVQTVSTTGTLAGDQSQIIGLNAPLDVLGARISFTVHWSVAATVSVTLYRCGSSRACQPFLPSDLIAEQTGTSGTLSWQSVAGEYFLFRSTVNQGPIKLVVDNTEPVLGGNGGLATLLFGVFLVTFGVWLLPLPSVPRRTARPADPLDLDREEPK